MSVWANMADACEALAGHAEGMQRAAAALLAGFDSAVYLAFDSTTGPAAQAKQAFDTTGLRAALDTQQRLLGNALEGAKAICEDAGARHRGAEAEPFEVSSALSALSVALEELASYHHECDAALRPRIAGFREAKRRIMTTAPAATAAPAARPRAAAAAVAATAGATTAAFSSNEWSSGNTTSAADLAALVKVSPAFFVPIKGGNLEAALPAEVAAARAVPGQISPSPFKQVLSRGDTCAEVTLPSVPGGVLGLFAAVYADEAPGNSRVVAQMQMASPHWRTPANVTNGYGDDDGGANADTVVADWPVVAAAAGAPDASPALSIPQCGWRQLRAEDGCGWASLFVFATQSDGRRRLVVHDVVSQEDGSACEVVTVMAEEVPPPAVLTMTGVPEPLRQVNVGIRMLALSHGADDGDAGDELSLLSGSFSFAWLREIQAAFPDNAKEMAEARAAAATPPPSQPDSPAGGPVATARDGGGDGANENGKAKKGIISRVFGTVVAPFTVVASATVTAVKATGDVVRQQQWAAFRRAFPHVTEAVVDAGSAASPIFNCAWFHRRVMRQGYLVVTPQRLCFFATVLEGKFEVEHGQVRGVERRKTLLFHNAVEVLVAPAPGAPTDAPTSYFLTSFLAREEAYRAIYAAWVGS